MHYKFETILKRENTELMVEIQFEYFLPSKFVQWQDKEHGSIGIVSVKSLLTDELLYDLVIEEHIQLRHACWDYLEECSLLLRPNVIDIFT